MRKNLFNQSKLSRLLLLLMGFLLSPSLPALAADYYLSGAAFRGGDVKLDEKDGVYIAENAPTYRATFYVKGVEGDQTTLYFPNEQTARYINTSPYNSSVKIVSEVEPTAAWEITGDVLPGEGADVHGNFSFSFDPTQLSLTVTKAENQGDTDKGNGAVFNGTATGSAYRDGTEYPYTLTYSITYNENKTLSIFGYYNWPNGAITGFEDFHNIYIIVDEAQIGAIPQNGKTFTTTTPYKLNDKIKIVFKSEYNGGVAEPVIYYTVGSEQNLGKSAIGDVLSIEVTDAQRTGPNSATLGYKIVFKNPAYIPVLENLRVRVVRQPVEKESGDQLLGITYLSQEQLGDITGNEYTSTLQLANFATLGGTDIWAKVYETNEDGSVKEVNLTGETERGSRVPAYNQAPEINVEKYEFRPISTEKGTGILSVYYKAKNSDPLINGLTIGAVVSAGDNIGGEDYDHEDHIWKDDKGTKDGGELLGWTWIPKNELNVSDNDYKRVDIAIDNVKDAKGFWMKYQYEYIIDGKSMKLDVNPTGAGNPASKFSHAAINNLTLVGQGMTFGTANEMNWSENMLGSEKVDDNTFVFRNVKMSDTSIFQIVVSIDEKYDWIERYVPSNDFKINTEAGYDYTFKGVGEKYSTNLIACNNDNDKFKNNHYLFAGQNNPYDIYVDVTNPINPTIWLDNATVTKYFLAIHDKEVELTLKNGILSATEHVELAPFYIKQTVSKGNDVVTTYYGPDANDEKSIDNLNGVYNGKAFTAEEFNAEVNSWVLSAVPFPGTDVAKTGTELNFYYNTRNGVLTVDNFNHGEGQNEIPEGSLIIYKDGKVNPAVSFYGWWGDTNNLKCTDAPGSAEHPVYSLTNNSGTYSGAGFNLERKTVASLHDGVLHFDWYKDSEDIRAHVKFETTVNGDGGKEGFYYTFTTKDDGKSGEWHHECVNLAQEFPRLAEFWEKGAGYGKGYVFSIEMPDKDGDTSVPQEKGTIVYANNVYYTHVDNNPALEKENWGNMEPSKVHMRFWEGTANAALTRTELDGTRIPEKTDADAELAGVAEGDADADDTEKEPEVKYAPSRLDGDGWIDLPKVNLTPEKRDELGIPADSNVMIWALEVADEYTPEPAAEPYVSQFVIEANVGWGYRPFYVDVHSNDTYVDAYSDFWCQHSRMEAGVQAKTIYFIYNPDADVNDANYETAFQCMFSSDGKYHYEAYTQQPLNSDAYSIKLSEGAMYDVLKGTQTDEITIPMLRHHIAKEGYSINLGKDVTIEEAQKFTFQVNGHPANVKFDLTKVYANEGDGVKGIGGTESTIAANVTFNKLVLIVDQHPTTGAYDQYTMYLVERATEPVDFASNGYEVKNGALDREAPKRPKLKVWDGNDAMWEGLYGVGEPFTKDENGEEIPNPKYIKGMTPDETSGKVKFYYFESIYTKETSEDNDTQKKTNIYFLDLWNDGNGVRINRYNGVNDMFNILDNEGYDISNPYQGSQVIYPGEWWCMNPSLGFRSVDELLAAYPEVDADDIREKDGFFFPPLPEHIGSSVVDIAWDLPEKYDKVRVDEDGNEYTTIYGITMFKIMGYGYDVYAQTFKERPFYYLYAEDDKQKLLDLDASIKKDQGNDIIRYGDLFERTAPIVLQVKEDGTSLTIDSDVNAVAEGGAKEPVRFRPENIHNTTALKESNGLKFYELYLSRVQLSGNDDLNWLVRDPETNKAAEYVNFIPKDAESIAFVDVTGQQTWDAYGEKDRLTPNKWSNYYSTYDATADDLQIDQYGDTEYFRLVLATNPDGARYQILALTSKATALTDTHFQSQNEAPESDIAPVADVVEVNGGVRTKNDKDAKYIYSTAELSLNFFWNKEFESIKVDLDITKPAVDDNPAVNVTQPLAFIQAKDTVEPFEDVEGADDVILNLEDTLNPAAVFVPQGENEAFLESGEYICGYDLGKFFIDPEWTINAIVTYTIGNDEKTETLKLPIDYITPSVTDVFPVEYGTGSYQKPFNFGSQGQDTYIAQLMWNNYEEKGYEGLPRTYEVMAQEQGKTENSKTFDELAHSGVYFAQDKDNALFSTHLDQYATNGEREDNKEAYKGFVISGCTPLSKEDQTVTIEYTVTPLYNYAVPANVEVLRVVNDVDSWYKTAPAAVEGSNMGSTVARKLAEGDTNMVKDGTEAGQFKLAKIPGDAAMVPIDYSFDISTGVEEVEAEGVIDAEVEIYNLQGVRVNAPLAPGIYIFRQGNTATKVLVK